jgi:DNA repair exonuclease SbcCD nuclease subunit
MKVAILNDTHAGARNSSGIWIKYQRRFYEEVFFPYCNKHNISQVLHLGDYYESRKNVNFKALNENRNMFLKPLVERNMYMNIIPGNHDVYHKNTNDLCALKELLGYYTKNVKIHMDPAEIDYDGLKIGLIPWITSQNYQEVIEFIRKTSSTILGAHLELQGFEVSRGIMHQHHGWIKSSELSKFDQVLSGHFHIASEQGNIRYLGSQIEFTWNDYNDKKYFHVLDTETREIEKVLNPIRMFEIIYYDDEVTDYAIAPVDEYKDKFIKVFVKNKTDPFLFDVFIDKIIDIGVHDLKISETFVSDIENTVVASNITDTGDLLNSYIDALDTQLDRERVKNIVHTLYTNAQSLEIQ